MRTPLPTLDYVPADGTLSIADISIYASRNRDNVVPFNTVGPAPGEVWKIDAFFVTNMHLSTAYYTITVAPNDMLRSATTGSGFPLVRYGDALRPVSHYGWGHDIAAGKMEGINTGGLIIRGDGPGYPATPPIKGRSIWLGAWPGANVNVEPAGDNDGVPAGITVSIHGERIA